MSASPGVKLLSLWQRLSGKPGGKWMFANILGGMVPYTGTIRPTVEELRPGYARVSMRDRRAVRNHLRSVHAVALMNLAEVTSGLAMMVALPDGLRGIVVGLSIEYFKKARGTLVAEATVSGLTEGVRGEYAFESEIRDATGTVVARATSRWLIGPVAAVAAAATGNAMAQATGARDRGVPSAARR